MIDLPLDADEKAVIRALGSKEIGRCERRQVLAKLAAEAEESGATSPIMDADYSVADPEGGGGSDGGPRGVGEDGDAVHGGPSASTPAGEEGSVPSQAEPKRKGHGRNGARACTNAKHIIHMLVAGVIGAICDACGIGRMSRYREKLVVVVKGQPLFDGAVHPFEQARCNSMARSSRRRARPSSPLAWAAATSPTTGRRARCSW